MFDSLEVSNRLTKAGMDRAQADAVADGVRRAAEHGDYVTAATLTAALDGLESRVIGWGLGIAFFAVSSTVLTLRLMG